MSDSMWVNDEVDANGDPLGVVQYTARELRRAQAMFLAQAGSPDRFGARSGVHPSGAPGVDLSGDTITVRNLKAVIYTALTTVIGPYTVQLPEETHTLAAADGGNDRKDIVILRQYDDDEDGSSQRTTVSEYLVGTPGSSPSEPSVPLGAFRLATIDVPAAGTGSPFLTYNAPYTVASGGIIPVREDAELPGTDGGMYDGLMRWNRATDELQVHNGSASWDTLASFKAPRGFKGWTTSNTDLVGINGSQIYMSQTFTAEANRYYSVTASLGFTGVAGIALGTACYWASGSSVTPADNQVGSVQYAHADSDGGQTRITGIYVADSVAAGTATIGIAIRTFNSDVTCSEGQMKVTDEGGF